MELKKYKLKDICTRITDGSHYSPKEQSSGYPMFSVKDMDEFYFSYDNVKKISKEDFDILKRNGCVPQVNDVLVAKDGSYLKESFVCKDEKEEAILSSIAIFRPNTSIVDPYYLSYLFKTPFVYKYVTRGCVSGTALPRIVLQAFKEIDLYIPPLSKQKKISSILSSLDRKIALNRAINKNLEALAKQLYDYWFVQFDFPDENGKPYKSSGGKMVWNEKLKREIPEGWDAMPIGDYAPCKGGFAFKSEDFCDNGVPVIKIGNIEENYTLNMADCQYINNFDNESFLAKKFDLVIAMTGATIGKFAISQGEFWVNQRVGRFDLGNNPLSKVGYLFNSMKLQYFRDQIVQIACGCAQPNISCEQIDSISILKPKGKILQSFNEFCEPLLRQQIDNILQNLALTKQRDELLPLLMNGQVTIE